MDGSYYRFQLLSEVRKSLNYGYRRKSIKRISKSDLSVLTECISVLSKSLEFLGNVDCILYERQGFICVEPYPDLSFQNINKRLDYTPFVRASCSTFRVRSVSSKFLLDLTGSYSLNHEFLWNNVGVESIKGIELLGKAVDAGHLSLKFPIAKIRFTVGKSSSLGVYYPSVLECDSIDIDLSDSVPAW